MFHSKLKLLIRIGILFVGMLLTRNNQVIKLEWGVYWPGANFFVELLIGQDFLGMFL